MGQDICTQCHKSIGLFNRKYKCGWCNRIYCSSCVKNVSFPRGTKNLFEQLADFPIPEYSVTKFHHVLCAVCASKFANCVRKMESAINEYKKVELVSIRYKGKKRYRGEEIYIETKYYKNREEAENVLRILACYYGKSLVLDFCYDKDIAEEETEKGGTYKYAVWSARGKAVEGY